MSSVEAVRSASSHFYAALSRMFGGDAGAVAAIWSHADSVSALHPLGGRRNCWSEVRDSFGQVALEEQLVAANGDLGCESGIERGEAVLAGEKVVIDDRVANVYRREADGWKIVQRHTDCSPAMVDLITRLKGHR